jgi:hypothetical protein
MASTTSTPKKTKKAAREPCIDFPTFIKLVEVAAMQVGGKVTLGRDSAGRHLAEIDLPTEASMRAVHGNTVTFYYSLDNHYHQMKYEKDRDSIIRTIREGLSLASKTMPNAIPQSVNYEAVSQLFPTVQPMEVCQRYFELDPRTGLKRKEFPKGIVFQPWSKESKDPHIALVFGYKAGPGNFKDYWVTDPVFLSSFESAAVAFEKSIQNLDRETPQRITIRKKGYGGLEESSKDCGYMLSSGSKIIITNFHDSRDCPRFLLPRVVKRFASELGGEVESLVVRLWKNHQVHVSCGSDRKAMLAFGKMLHSRGMQEEETEVVCKTPFMVRT